MGISSSEGTWDCESEVCHSLLTLQMCTKYDIAEEKSTPSAPSKSPLSHHLQQVKSAAMSLPGTPLVGSAGGALGKFVTGWEVSLLQRNCDGWNPWGLRHGHSEQSIKLLKNRTINNILKKENH